MSDQQRPAKRTKYDLKPSFSVQVGSEIFWLHTTVFTERSRFFQATRRPEWLRDDPNRVVDLQDVDAEAFSTYVNCVYFGPSVLQHHADAIASVLEAGGDTDDLEDEHEDGLDELVKVYQVADRLQDLATANMAIDELLRYGDMADFIPGEDRVSLVYGHTPENSPLRLLMRDYWVYDMRSSEAGELNDLPPDFIKDVASEFFRLMTRSAGQTVKEAKSKTPEDNTNKDKCYYHQHDDKHPRCVPKLTSSRHNK